MPTHEQLTQLVATLEETVREFEEQNAALGKSALAFGALAERLNARLAAVSHRFANALDDKGPCSRFDACARARSRFKLLARSVGRSFLLHPNRVASRG